MAPALLILAGVYRLIEIYFINNNNSNSIDFPRMVGVGYVTRRVQISAAHRLHNPALDGPGNDAVYGRCTGLHGHNYTVELTWRGPLDSNGMVLDLRVAKELVERCIVRPLDHCNLDQDLEHFRLHPSTGENLAVFIFQQVRAQDTGSAVLYRVRVHETDNNVFEFMGEEGM